MKQRSSHQPVERVICPYCQAPVRPGENTVVCSGCRMPHHLECWMENGQCTTYGCKGHRQMNPSPMVYRRRMQPVIEISFDEPETSPSGSGWIRRYRWPAAALTAALIGSGLYWVVFL